MDLNWSDMTRKRQTRTWKLSVKKRSRRSTPHSDTADITLESPLMVGVEGLESLTECNLCKVNYIYFILFYFAWLYYSFCSWDVKIMIGWLQRSRTIYITYSVGPTPTLATQSMSLDVRGWRLLGLYKQIIWDVQWLDRKIQDFSWSLYISVINSRKIEFGIKWEEMVQNVWNYKCKQFPPPFMMKSPSL